MIQIARNPLQILSVESEEERRRAATIGEADIQAAVQFVRSFQFGGKAPDLGGRAVGVPAQQAKSFWEQTNGIVWSHTEAEYSRKGKVLADVVTKAAAESVTANMKRGEISRLIQQLAAKTITTDEFYAGMKETVKNGQMAAMAVARGGWGEVRPADWGRLEPSIFEQYNGNDKFPGLRKFAEDIKSGRYGTDQLMQGAWSRAAAYAESPRQVYENEHVLARQEAGHEEAIRLLAAVDHCADCLEWAAMGWIPIDEMLGSYAIGVAACGSRDHCRIATRRVGGREAESVVRAREAAAQKWTDYQLIQATKMKEKTNA